MKELIKKIQSDSLSEMDKQILIETLKEQGKCIDYYSQNFVGTWDCDEVNVNWRAKDCKKNIEDKIK